ncbi:hypothetical protein PENTCL1PPCAC_30147, partial [Pristionchus entomophagus]
HNGKVCSRCSSSAKTAGSAAASASGPGYCRRHSDAAWSAIRSADPADGWRTCVHALAFAPTCSQPTLLLVRNDQECQGHRSVSALWRIGPTFQ